MERCTGGKEVVITKNGLAWKCSKCGATWGIDPRNLKAARVELGRRATRALYNRSLVEGN